MITSVINHSSRCFPWGHTVNRVEIASVGLFQILAFEHLSSLLMTRVVHPQNSFFVSFLTHLSRLVCH